MKTYKKGISLIVLVVTIIVLAILATTVIIALSGDNGNIISEGKEAVFKSNVRSYQEELNMYIATQFSANKTTDIDATGSDMTAIIPSMKAEDVSKFEIVNGKLKYIGTDSTETEIAESMGIAMTEEEKYNAKYATEIQNALSVGEVEGTKYIFTADGVGSITELAIPYGCTSMDVVIEDENGESDNDRYPLSALSKLIIPGSMTTVGVFSMFGGPVEIIFCEGITTLDAWLLQSNVLVKTIYLPSTLTEVGDYTFSYTGIEDVYFGGTEEQWNALDIKITSLNTSTYEEQEYTVHFNVKY